MSARDEELTADEGVNEASADSTAETAGNTGALAAASQDGRPEGEYDPAPPVDMESDDSREARDKTGDGQQLQAGEG